MNDIGSFLDEVRIVVAAAGDKNEKQSLRTRRSNNLLVRGNTIKRGGSKHSNVKVGITKPLDSLVSVPNRSKNDFGVEVVGKLGDELRFNGELLVHHTEVVLKFRMIGDDDTFSESVVLRSTSSSKHLQDILRRQFHPTTFLGVVDLGSLDDDDVGGKVDSPGESRRRDQNLDTPVVEEVLDEGSIGTVHSGVMDGESERKDVFEGGIGHAFRFSGENFASGGVGAEELGNGVHLESVVTKISRSLGGFFTTVDKDDDLILPSVFHALSRR